MNIKDEDIRYIYKITNKTNNFVYIGQTINIEERWKNHCKPSSRPMGKVIEEYKKDKEQ